MTDASAADGPDFRKVMGRFATGVTVVTSRRGEDIHGMTVNAFLSVSLKPPTVLVSLSKNTRTERLVLEGGVFAVNILSGEQQALSDRFAGRHKDKEADRFEGFEWTAGQTGAPLFKGALAALECRLLKSFDVGDHTLCLGEVVAAQADERPAPLIFFKSGYRSLA
jgi:flavin reductase (DIM6/NTAB) family NADH-FMN oxidoreductase RutF